jgi:CheY-like chemotaxis protein
VAHDLNNILSPILMSAGALKDSGLSADNLAMAQAIEDCAQRGADIVRQLLTFARGEPGIPAVLNLRDLARAVEKLIRATFPPEVRLESQVIRDVWPVMGDALRLHQALMNLCLNARDAMPDGGTLSLALSNVNVDAAFAAMVPGASIGHYVCLSVSDTGSGIAADQLDQVFDPYYTTKEEGRGTGLGLPTVMGIVQGLGGFMRINSIPGTGTVVELYLPATAAAEAGRGGGFIPALMGGQGETILVVDDETAVRESLRRTLERHGYRVLEASHGAEALAVFARNEGRIQLILTDMMMPVMNGPALVQAVRSIDLRVPIVGMTGLADPKRVKGLERVALTAMLEKPFSGDRLLKTLAVTLPRRLG